MLWIMQFNVEIYFSEQTQSYSYNKQQFYANWYITFSKHHNILNPHLSFIQLSPCFEASLPVIQYFDI